MLISEGSYLEHYGVKGMQWGKRKGPREFSRRTEREAAKDAKEFALAKQFTGEGAGNRRKHIKNTVEAKKKRDSNYAKAFDKKLGEQQQKNDKVVSKAKKQRKSIDRRTRNKQRVGAIARNITGSQGTQAAFVAIALGGAAYLNSPRGRATMSKTLRKIKDTASNLADDRKRKAGAKFLNDYLKRNM